MKKKKEDLAAVLADLEAHLAKIAKVNVVKANVIKGIEGCLNNPASVLLGKFDDPEFEAKVKLEVEKGWRTAILNGLAQADFLMEHGWKWELPSRPDSEVWQWAWRRPPRRAGWKGMRFASTNQAYMHLCRSLGVEPKIP